jgi:ATP-binding cassette, subfamily B, bacterial
MDTVHLKQAHSHDGEASGPTLQRLVLTSLAAWRIVWRAAPRELAVTVCVQVVGAVAVAAQLLLVKSLLEDLTSDAGIGSLGDHVWLLAGLAVFTATASGSLAVVSEMQRVLMELVQRDLEEKIIDVVVGVELETLDDDRFHDRHQRAMTAFVDRPFDLVHGIVSAFGAVLGVAAIAVVLIPINPWLLPAALLAAVPLGWVTTRNSTLLYGRYRAMAKLDRTREYLREVLTAPRTAAEIRLFEAQNYLKPKYRTLYDERITIVRVLGRQRIRRLLSVQVGVALFGVGLLALLIEMAVSGTLSVADAAVAAVAVQQLMQRLRMANSSAGSMHEASLFLGDLTSFLDTPVSAVSQARDLPAALPTDPQELVLDHVDFSYPGTSRQVLHDVSMRIPKGEIVALVGPNGAGKTTLVKLLCGLYVPNAGTIGAAGPQGLRPLDRDQRRHLVTALFQDFNRYALSVRDNVALSEPVRSADETALSEAVSRAGISQLVEGLPHGFDTVLSREFELGTDLSVGQWQRVALARALFRKAPFMILDEPTAAADARSEQAFIDDLRRAGADRGILIITHRLSTARRADRTYVLEHGRIVEAGTHQQLVDGAGAYAELERLQGHAR